MLRNIFYLIGALTIIIINAFIGYHYAPKGIDYTPVVVVSTTAIMVFGLRCKLVWKSIFAFSGMVLNDVLILLYSGGRHDGEGLIWINLFMYLGILPAFILLCIVFIRNKNEAPFSKVVAIGVFSILVFLYLFVFENGRVSLYHFYMGTA